MKNNSLSTRHELFARAIASGANQSQAVKLAGYKTKYPSEIGRRLVEKSGVRERIWELIEERDYARMACNTWTEILTYETKNLDEFIKVCSLKLKAIDQIARLGGWEIEQQPQNSFLSGGIQSWLPTDGR